jgi:7-cyano-7-deazaguanine synthase in queuosine biosynthesis
VPLSYSESKFDAVVPLSGGIDSTAALYSSLKNHPDKNFLVFRVQMFHGTSGHRTIREQQACEDILNWLEKNGLNNFAYRPLSIDYSSLGPTPPVWDSEVINYMAALVVLAHPEIKYFVEGAIADDFDDPDFDRRLEKIIQIFYTVSGRSAENFHFEFPVRGMRKYEVMTSIPEELLRLTWSCRYPEIGAPYTFVRCHKCPQCRVIDQVIEEHPELNRSIGKV